MSDTSTDSVKQRMQAALTTAMKARDEVSMSALRQALAEVAVAETAGAELVVLSDEAVLAVLAAEVRKHHETADAFVTAGRPEKVERERAEAAVLEAYLPAALSDADLDAIIAAEIAAAAAAAADGATGMKAMGKVVSAVRAKAGPTADGAAIAAKVKSALSA